jgi:membrane dipeptidase
LIDSHNDVTSETVDGLDIGEPHAGRTDIPKLREGGIGAVFFAVYVDAQYVDGNRSAHRALDMIDTVRHDIVDRYPRDFALALTADDIEAARKQGRIAALLGIEGGHAIEQPAPAAPLLRTGRPLHDAHAHEHQHRADARATLDDPNAKCHNGLTDFGKDVVHEMNRLGMMVISRTSPTRRFGTLEVSRAPVFASHSSCRSISAFRNMTDEMIVALGKTRRNSNNFLCEFVSQKSEDVSGPQRTEPLRRMRESARRIRMTRPGATRKSPRCGEIWTRASRATLADVVANIDHVVKIAGIDAVGIGPDYDGTGCAPQGIDDMSKFSRSPALC